MTAREVDVAEKASRADTTRPVELTIVTMVFDAADNAERLQSVLAKYVVLARHEPGCRNIDLCASVTTPGRCVVIEKWESRAAQRAHFDSPVMVEMAQA